MLTDGFGCRALGDDLDSFVKRKDDVAAVAFVDQAHEEELIFPDCRALDQIRVLEEVAYSPK